MEKTIFYRSLGKDEHYRIWHENSDGIILYMNSEGGDIVFSTNCFPIRKGILCYIPAHTFHYTTPEDASSYLRSKLAVPDSLVVALSGSSLCFSENLFSHIVCAQIPEVHQDAVDLLFKEIAENRNNELAPLLLLGNTAKLLYYLKKYSTDTIAATENTLTEAILYINSHIFEDLTLEDITQHININKSYFCRYFKKKMGISPMQYVLLTRLTLAKDMLKKTDASISETAYNCGFGNVSLFCRSFHKFVGMTPRQYRKDEGSSSMPPQ